MALLNAGAVAPWQLMIVESFISLGNRETICKSAASYRLERSLGY